jgi:hypothetical protein
MLGEMRAGSILFLGNSVTLHGPSEEAGWPNNCGMAASVPENDYVHLLAARIAERTGTELRVSATESEATGPDGAAVTLGQNVINIADIFERNYGTYEDARLEAQLSLEADIVVLQFGENMPRETFDPDAYGGGLRRLVAGLKASGDPSIFMAGQILGAGGAIDEIKQQVCAEDPEHRVFVDLSAFGADATNLASAEPYFQGVITGHPGDKGMEFIATKLFEAMEAHATAHAAIAAP